MYYADEHVPGRHKRYFGKSVKDIGLCKYLLVISAFIGIIDHSGKHIILGSVNSFA